MRITGHVTDQETDHHPTACKDDPKEPEIVVEVVKETWGNTFKKIKFLSSI